MMNCKKLSSRLASLKPTTKINLGKLIRNNFIQGKQVVTSRSTTTMGTCKPTHGKHSS